jgi:hypothetical protein
MAPPRYAPQRRPWPHRDDMCDQGLGCAIQPGPETRANPVRTAATLPHLYYRQEKNTGQLTVLTVSCTPLLHVAPTVAVAGLRTHRLDKEGVAGMLGIELASDNQASVDESRDDFCCALHRALRQ